MAQEQHFNECFADIVNLLNVCEEEYPTRLRWTSILNFLVFGTTVKQNHYVDSDFNHLFFPLVYERQGIFYKWISSF